MDEVKLRLTIGLTAARLAAVTAERWRNMVGVYGLVCCVVNSPTSR